jgi:hypothetical protein
LKKKVQDDSDDDDEPAFKVKETGKTAKLVTDQELLARFYGQNETLDPTDRFLRNYILNEGWKDKS